MADDTGVSGRNWNSIVSSTLGDLTLVRDREQLRGLYFPHHWYRPHEASFGMPFEFGFTHIVAQLNEYLAGTRRAFDLNSPRRAALSRNGSGSWSCRSATARH